MNSSSSGGVVTAATTTTVGSSSSSNRSASAVTSASSTNLLEEESLVLTNNNNNNIIDDIDIAEDDDDDDEIAVAAEAAANAVEEADAAVQQAQQQQQLSSSLSHHNFPVCRICGQGGSIISPPNQQSLSQSTTNHRPMLRFLPTIIPCDVATTSSDVTDTFSEDAWLHIFCGKTAGFVFISNNPHHHTTTTGDTHQQQQQNNDNNNNARWEIMSKAGLKHKYGIGREVNAALNRTRFAMVPDSNATAASMSGSNKKQSLATRQYYLVREFEANLIAVQQNGSALLENINGKRRRRGGTKKEQLQQNQKQQNQVHQQHQGLLLAPAPSSESTTSLVYPHPFHAPGVNDALFQYQLHVQQTDGSNTVPAASAFGIPSSPSQDSTTPTSSPPVEPMHHPPILPLYGPGLLNFSSFPTSGAAALLPAASIDDITTTTVAQGGGKSKVGAAKATAGKVQKMQVGQETYYYGGCGGSDINNNTTTTLSKQRFDKQGRPVDKTGKVRCGCGGRHKPDDGSYAGTASWRNHVLTKQHQKWLQKRAQDTHSTLFPDDGMTSTPSDRSHGLHPMNRDNQVTPTDASTERGSSEAPKLSGQSFNFDQH
jgi:hypothetical protein